MVTLLITVCIPVGFYGTFAHNCVFYVWKLRRRADHFTTWNSCCWTAAILTAGEPPHLATSSSCALSTFCRVLISFWRRHSSCSLRQADLSSSASRSLHSRVPSRLTGSKDTQVNSEQCCGSGMFIPDPNFFHPDPGSEFYPSRIPDTHQRI